jgi:hypothetical protein
VRDAAGRLLTVAARQLEAAGAVERAEIRRGTRAEAVEDRAGRRHEIAKARL